MIYSIATQDDLLDVAAFARSTYATAFGNDLGEARLREHLNAAMSDARFAEMMGADVFHLAVHGDDLVGFAQVGAVDQAYRDRVAAFDERDGEIRRLYVLAGYQGEGIGSALLGRTLQHPMVAGAGGVYLTTWEANHGAQKLYRRHGFTQVGAIPEYGADGRLEGHEIIMRRAC